MVDVNYWTDDPFRFDMSSVMLYCSTCSSSTDDPAMTLKDGTTFETAFRASTVDILEIQVRLEISSFHNNCLV